jgi:hypothetical protein
MDRDEPGPSKRPSSIMKRLLDPWTNRLLPKRTLSPSATDPSRSPTSSVSDVQLTSASTDVPNLTGLGPSNSPNLDPLNITDRPTPTVSIAEPDTDPSVRDPLQAPSLSTNRETEFGQPKSSLKVPANRAEVAATLAGLNGSYRIVQSPCFWDAVEVCLSLEKLAQVCHMILFGFSTNQMRFTRRHQTKMISST